MQDQGNVYIEMKCLVDSGCEVTLVPKKLIKRFGNVEIRPAVRHVWAANNSPLSIEGEIELPFILNDRCLWTTALVSEDIEEVMLGIDWLERYGCIWDWKSLHRR